MDYDMLLREIRSKGVILYNRGPFDDRTKAAVEVLEAGAWLRMHLRLEGSGLTEADLNMLADGGYVLTATVREHLLLQRLPALRSYIYRLSDSGAALSLQIIEDMHGIITGAPDQKAYRDPAVEAPLRDLIRFARTGGTGGLNGSGRADGRGNRGSDSRSAEGAPDFLQKAAFIHDRLRQIRPYGEDGGDDALLARAAMYYWLVGQGYPMAALLWDRDTYEAAYQRYLSRGDSLALAAGLGQAVLVRLEQMIRLLDSEKEM